MVIFHDDTIDRCTNNSGSLSHLRVSDLEDIDAGQWFGDDYRHERIPTFTQLIELANRLELNVNVEIKSCTTGWEKTLKLIGGVAAGPEKLDPARKVIVSSFNHIAQNFPGHYYCFYNSSRLC